MCLSIPSKIETIHDNNTATVDTMGIKRDVSLDLMPEPPVVGDYVLIHVGFAMNKIDEEDALESLKLYREILEKMDERERRETVLEDDNCPER